MGLQIIIARGKEKDYVVEGSMERLKKELREAKGIRNIMKRRKIEERIREHKEWLEGRRDWVLLETPYPYPTIIARGKALDEILKMCVMRGMSMRFSSRAPL